MYERPRESPDCPTLRASDDHNCIVRIQRAQERTGHPPVPFDRVRTYCSSLIRCFVLLLNLLLRRLNIGFAGWLRFNQKNAIANREKNR